jgi:hypothetical protein
MMPMHAWSGHRTLILVGRGAFSISEPVAAGFRGEIGGCPGTTSRCGLSQE